MWAQMERWKDFEWLRGVGQSPLQRAPLSWCQEIYSCLSRLLKIKKERHLILSDSGGFGRDIDTLSAFSGDRRCLLNCCNSLLSQESVPALSRFTPFLLLLSSYTQFNVSTPRVSELEIEHVFPIGLSYKWSFQLEIEREAKLKRRLFWPRC